MLQLETKSTSAITALAFSPDGMRLLVGYGKGQVLEWDAFGSLLHATQEQDWKETACYAVAWMPCGESWAYACDSDFIAVKAGEKMDVFSPGGRGSVLTALAFFTDDFAVFGEGHPTETRVGSLRLHTFVWDERRAQPQPHFEDAGVRGLDIHRESRLVAWITGHAQLKLWHINRPDKYLIQLKKTAKCVALSPDGLTVAVAVEWAILTFSTDKRFPLQEMKGHKGKVTSIAFSPDGSRIVSGSWDETVREWDVATGKELRSMNWKIGQIAALSYAPDGTRIAAGSTGGKVIIWDVD